MLTELTNVRRVFLAACLLASSPLVAFEPGSERTCEPSADGERFVCRDASGKVDETAEQTSAEVTQPAPAAAAEPEAAPEPEALPPSDAIPSSTSKLPSYLLHNPGAAPRRAAAAPAAPPARSKPVQSAPPMPAPAAAPAASSTASTSAPAATRSDSAQPEPAQVPAKASVADTPAPAEAAQPSATTSTASRPATSPAPTEPAPTPARTQSEPAAATSSRPTATAKPVAARPNPARPPVATASSRSGVSSAAPQSQRPLLNAADFMKLPGSHYTLVLDSARSPTEFNALVATLEDLPGNLYLVGLNMPDGRWYSLCWSNFDSLDAARGARADLPADAPIASGWPRRISLLQSEIQ
ncbi:SPOR domain-containing protein [Dokdonella sp.]|uniref:SPOR domain-containing protein n=1 Tax=Dokdonella sp. TaxID=2291710 RepID=UPI003528E67D